MDMLWVRHQRRRRAGHGAPIATGGSVACDRRPIACNRQARARALTAARLLAIFRQVVWLYADPCIPP